MPTIRKSKKRDTIYLAKVAVLGTLAYVLHLLRFKIFPVFPFSVLELDFSYIPSLLGGFSLGPVAAVLIEIIKNGIKIASQSSDTFFVGDLSNLIVSLSFVLPASIVYRARKTYKSAIVGLVIGFFVMLTLSSLSNYFIIVPMYAAAFADMSAVLMEARVLFAFAYGLGFNALKGIINACIVVLVYKRLSPILHFNVRDAIDKSVYKTHLLETADDTIALGERLGKKLRGGETVFLHGELGAGKTTFTKGIAKGLGITDEILSPTFILMKTYNGRLTLNHVDMYRLDQGAEIADLGLDDVLYNKQEVTVIEWNKLPNIKGSVIFVDFEYTEDNQRRVTLRKQYVK